MNSLCRILAIKAFCLILLISLSEKTIAQGVGINDDNSSPDGSAMLDVKSTSKGLLIPRMTTTERTTISTPATGLMVFDNTTLSFWYYDGSQWIEIGSTVAESPFDTSGGVVLPRIGMVDETTDDFLFGSTQLDDDGDTDHDSRLFFDKSKAAFRVGSAYTTVWDEANVGDYSIALGWELLASGNSSFAAGSWSSATGLRSVVIGFGCEATGSGAVALGYSNESSGDYSTTFGLDNTASGLYSTAFGRTNWATGSQSTAFGRYCGASGTYATSFGHLSSASGQGSFAAGLDADARSYFEVSLGTYPTTYTATGTTSFDASDRLFSIGNGTGSSARSNALTIYKDGTMNINDAYDMPTADGTANYVMTTDGAGVVSWADPNAIVTATSPFDTSGGVVIPRSGLVDETNDDFVFGATQLDDDGDINHDNRFFFDKSLGAFRAGRVYSDDWDEANRGEYSVAFGSSNVASGDYSTALGESNDALGRDAMVWGRGNDATAYLSTAWGFVTEASGSFATAWGRSNYATGTLSTAWGNNVESPSYLETALGAYSTTYTPNSAFSWDNNDRLFSIGNGTGSAALSNALTIYKDGTMNINDAYDMPTADGTANYVMATDGAGVASWVDPNALVLATSPFDTAGGVVIPRSGLVDETNDDFVFGSTQLDDDGNSNHDNRLFFDKSKGAFRAGSVTGTEWDDASVGDYSTALGYDNTASGENSVAFGRNNIALGVSSTAFGFDNIASGNYTTIFGYDNIASGYSSTAFGFGSVASGWISMASGHYTEAPSSYETVIGRHNTTYTPLATTGWNTADRLFVIGNGTGSASKSDALIVYKNGSMDLQGNLYFGTDGAFLSSTNQGGSLELGPTNSAGGEIPFVDFHYGVGSSQDYNVRIINNGNNQLTIATNSGGDVLQVDGSRVGIGTNPSYELHVSTNSAAKPTSSAWTVTSDERLKTNVEPFNEGLNLIKTINPVWFSYNGKAGLPTDERGVGTIAQELQKVAPYMVRNWTYKNEDGSQEEYLSVDYGAMDFVLVNAIKEQQQTIEQQEAKIKQLEIKVAKTNELESQLKATNQRLERIEQLLTQDSKR